MIRSTMIRSTMIRPTMIYPEFEFKSSRLSSFQEWPSENLQIQDELIGAGFFYSGTADTVKCFHCGIQLCNWKDDDVPLCEHAKFSKDCAYLKQIVHEDFIHDSQLNNSIEQSENKHERVTQYQNTKSMSLPSFESPSSTPEPPSEEGAYFICESTLFVRQQSLLDGRVALEREELRLAEQRRALQQNRARLESEKVALKLQEVEVEYLAEQRRVFENEKAALRLQEVEVENERRRIDNRLVELVAEQERIINADLRLKQQRSIVEETQGNTQELCSEFISLYLDEEERNREQELRRSQSETIREEDLHKCKVCLTNICEIAFIPCGHMSCNICYPQLTHCHVCRGTVNDTLKIYF